jgi:DNA-binding transcriptional ArsR family regulator
LLTTAPPTTLPTGSELEEIVASPDASCTWPKVQAVLRALAEPNRLEILRLVWRRELPAGQTASQFHLPRTTVSEPLHILETAGLLAGRRQGSLRLYGARPERIAAPWAFLASLR